MNRRLALKVFIIDKETSGLVIIKNKSLVPLRALGFIFNNHQAIGLYLLLKEICSSSKRKDKLSFLSIVHIHIFNDGPRNKQAKHNATLYNVFFFNEEIPSQ